MPSPTPTARPYRSHKTPACHRCKQRKIRCLAEQQRGACRPCRESNTRCSRQMSASRSRSPTAPERGLDLNDHVRVRAANENENYDDGLPTSLPLPLASGQQAHTHDAWLTRGNAARSTLVVSPAVNEDLDVLEKYLAASGSLVGDRRAHHRPVAEARDPVYSVDIPRGRQSRSNEAAREAGKPQREILEQVLGPFKDEVVKLFFQNVHPCFPILDREAFERLWRGDPGRISDALVCEIYAAGLLYWKKSKKLKAHPQPDLAFAWTQAAAALEADFRAPSLSTLHASLIDMCGRPVLGITGNVLNVGRTANFAHSLGLHRDPSNWKISHAEKNLRIRLWCAVRIHDTWSSYAHGIPPNTNPSFSDVPLPEKTHLSMARSAKICAEDEIFPKLCSLLRTLADILQILYTLPSETMNTDDLIQPLTKLEESSELESRALHQVPGGCTLQLCFHLVALLLYRVALKLPLGKKDMTPFIAAETEQGVSVMTAEEQIAKRRRNQLGMLRFKTFLIITFVSGIPMQSVDAFWLPYIAHLLPSTVTIILRIILDLPDLEERNEEIQNVVKFMQTLQRLRTEHGWDIADLCLERCSMPVKRVAELIQSQVENQATIQQQQQASDLELWEDFSGLPSFLLPDSTLEDAWDGGWSAV